MKTEGHFGHDVGLNATAMTASIYLAWYCRHPRATREFLEWVDAWVEDTMREAPGKPAGRIPSWGDFATHELGADRGTYPSEITMMMMAAYQLTGDEKYLRPLQSYLESKHEGWYKYLNMAAADLRRDVGHTDHDALLTAYANATTEQLHQGLFFQRGLYGQELSGVLGWLATGKPDDLEVATWNAWRCNRYGRNIDTVEDAHKDRVYPWGRSVLPWMCCGGNALNRRGSGPWPTVRVSWSNTGYECVPWMREESRSHLRAVVYNFAAEREVGMTVWNMAPGVYELVVTPDGREPERKSVSLHRGETVRFAVPSTASAELSLTKSRPSEWMPERPDLALSRHEGATVADGEATVTVHNVGSRDAPACRASLLAGDRTVAETDVPPLPAPLDFQPGRVQVQFALPAEAPRALQVVVDSVDEVDEISEANNVLTVGR